MKTEALTCRVVFISCTNNSLIYIQFIHIYIRNCHKLVCEELCYYMLCYNSIHVWRNMTSFFGRFIRDTQTLIYWVFIELLTIILINHRIKIWDIIHLSFLWIQKFFSDIKKLFSVIVKDHNFLTNNRKKLWNICRFRYCSSRDRNLWELLDEF